MKKIKYLLQLRRSDDDIKIFLIIVLAAIFISGNAIYQGIQFYSELNQPEEYIFIGGKWNEATDGELLKIKQLENITDATPQLNYSLTLVNGDKTIQIPCYAVSAEYMKTVYGVEYSNEEIYLTAKAYSQIIKEKSHNDITGHSYYQLEYSLDTINTGYMDENTSIENMEHESGIGKIRLLNKGNTQENYALIVKSLSKLKQGSTQIRVYMSKQDIDGMTIKNIKNKNYMMERDESYLLYKANQRMTLLKIRYHLIIGILCMFFSVILWRIWKKYN